MYYQNGGMISIICYYTPWPNKSNLIRVNNQQKSSEIFATTQVSGNVTQYILGVKVNSFTLETVD